MPNTDFGLPIYLFVKAAKQPFENDRRDLSSYFSNALVTLGYASE